MKIDLFVLILLILGFQACAQNNESCELNPEFIPYVDLDLIPCALDAKISNPHSYCCWREHWDSNGKPIQGTFDYDVVVIGDKSDNKIIFNPEVKAIRIEGKKALNRLFKNAKELSAIEFLDIVGSDIDSIPGEVWNLKNIRFLKISAESNISISDDIGKLAKLESLILDNNSSLKYLSSNIFRIKNLKRLEIPGTASLLDSIHLLNKLSNLEFLNLEDNGTSFDYIDFKNFNNLEFLKLEGWNSTISNLSNLKAISIDRPINYEQAKILSTNKKLKELIIRVKDSKTLDELTILPNLKMMYLSINFVLEANPMSKQFNDLDYLYLAFWDWNPASINESLLSGFSNLCYLDVFTHFKHPVTIEKEILETKRIKYFKITGNINQSDEMGMIGTTKIKMINNAN